MSLRAQLGVFPQDFPQELFDYLGNFFTLPDLDKPVSKAWAGYFSTPYRWKALVQALLGASNELIIAFEKDAESQGLIVNYKAIYQRLYYFKKIESCFPADVRQCYRAPRYHLSLLIFCLDNCNYLLRSVPAVELLLWFRVAYDGRSAIAQELFLQADMSMKLKLLNFALQVGNLEKAQEFYAHIIKDNKDFRFKATHIDSAARSGNLALITWMLAAHSGLQLRRSSCVYACVSGNKEMIAFVADKMRMDSEFDYVMFCEVIQSGNREAIDWFKSRFNFELSEEQLPFVIKSGDQTFVEEFISTHGISYQRHFLNLAIQSSSLDLFKYFLQTYEMDLMTNCKEYRRKAAIGDIEAKNLIESLDAAMADVGKVGNVEILKFCHQVLGLAMTQELLDEAILSGDIASFDYVHQHLPHVLKGESFSEKWLKGCPNPELANFLRAHREVQSMLTSCEESTSITSLNGDVLSALLNIFTHAKDYSLNKLNVRTLIRFLERLLPADFEGVKEKYLFKNLMQQIKASPLVSQEDKKRLKHILNREVKVNSSPKPEPLGV